MGNTPIKGAKMKKMSKMYPANMKSHPMVKSRMSKG